MKKIFLGILSIISIIILSACSDNIRFEISDYIEIELSQYNKDYDYSNYVRCYQNDVEVDYNELSFTTIDNPIVNIYSIFVSYKNDKKEFKINIVNSLIKVNINIYYGAEKRNYNLIKGKGLDSLNLDDNYTMNNKEVLAISGYYKEYSYKNKVELNEPINCDMDIYAKCIYGDNSIINKNDSSSIINNLNNYINKLITNTSSYIPSWNKEGFKGRWNYIDGVFLNSIINLYKETNNEDYKNFVIKYVNYYIDKNGDFINPEGKGSGYRDGELDSVCESRILFDLYDYTNDSRYLKAINNTYQSLNKVPKALGTNNYSHKESYLNQIWLDGMYMYIPFLARYAKMINNSSIFDDIKGQYEYIRNNMFDEDKSLYYHGHDTTKSIFWANSNTGNSESFWLRSNGWFIVSLVDVLEYYPNGSNKNYLISLLKEAIDGILLYQDERSSMFYQLVDKGPTLYFVNGSYLNSLNNSNYKGDSSIKNYLESSGSAMVAYSLMKASRLGYINGSYMEKGRDTFEGIYNYSFKNLSLGNICITAGLGPSDRLYRDGSIAYYLAEEVGNDDAKGVGPFIMAFIEYDI